VKKFNSKIIAIFCLLIYCLFGFFNTGNIGFCLGDEHGSHFGLVIAGHETCCHNDEHCLSGNETNFGCECNDVDIKSTVVSQTQMNISNVINIIETIVTNSFCTVAYCINNIEISQNQLRYYQKAPPDLLIKNSSLIQNSVILLI
jgi:hypothetical protein